jgi:hypothetical protein
MIRLFDDVFNFLCEIDDYEKLEYTRKHYGAGDFSFKLSSNAAHANLFKNVDYFIVIDQDPRKAGIIRFFEQVDKNDSMIEIKGYTLESLLSRRIVIPLTGSAYDVVSGPAETAIKHYVVNNVTTPEDSARAIACFSLATDQARGITAKKYARYEGLLDVIGEIGEQAAMGFEVMFDLNTKSLIFDVVPGTDHTEDAASPVIFSMEYDNLESQTYTVDASSEKSTAYVGGAGEETSRPVIVAGGSASGLSRIEAFVNASSADVVDLPDIGAQELETLKKIESIEGIALGGFGPFQEGVDYVLGDTVTVANRSSGQAMDVQIVEVKETINEKGHEVALTFGIGLPRASEVLKNKFKQYDKILRR